MAEGRRRVAPAAVIGRAVGPLIFLLIMLSSGGDLGSDGKRVVAVVLWMAVWWVTEAVPLAVTALLPLVMFPLLGARAAGAVAPNYSNQIIFLFFGGFVLALAVEKSGLHRRLALSILDAIGASPRRLVWGFLVATALLSMWLSNTATTLMMLPIAGGVAARMECPEAPTRLMLAVAYGASIGGIGTLVGTPPNLVLAGMAPNLLPDLEPFSFGGWMLFGVPFVILFLPVVALQLGRGLAREHGDDGGFRAEREALGRMNPAERRVAVLFACTAAAWISRAGFDFGAVTIPGWSELLARWGVIPDPTMITDAVPAVAAAVLCTLVPAGGGENRALLTWEQIRHGVPWGVLLLFGGGFAIADSVRAAGVDGWLAGRLENVGALPVPLMIFALCAFTTSATELTSNTATATLLMPVMAALGSVLGVHPYLLMVPATVSASCAFMLPVATPPNAIVIGSGRVSARDLAREGLWLNLAGAVVTTIVVLTLGRLVLPL